MTFRTKIGAKPLRIRFDKVDEFTRFYDGPDRYLALFDPENCDAIYNSIRYLISQGSGITYVFLIIMQEPKLIHVMLCL